MCNNISLIRIQKKSVSIRGIRVRLILRLYSDYIPRIFFSHRSYRWTQIIFSHTNIYFLTRISRISRISHTPSVVAKLTTKSVKSESSVFKNKIRVNLWNPCETSKSVCQYSWDSCDSCSKTKSVLIRVICGRLILTYIMKLFFSHRSHRFTQIIFLPY